MAHKGMTFGIFLAPFHRLGENPTLALSRDMELIEWLDWLGYDEVWVGEHDPCAVAGEPTRGRRADAARGAGDEHDAAVKLGHGPSSRIGR